jgi:hypothetical protein
MKFAAARTDPRAPEGKHLPQQMLHNFRRIHAAKRSFRDRIAVAIARYASYFNRLSVIPLRRSNCGMLRLCCSKRAA